MEFAIRSTQHTTLQATPGHLVFRCDMILNTPFIADWEDIRLLNQNIIDKNNQLEKKQNLTHRIGDKLLVCKKGE